MFKYESNLHKYDSIYRERDDLWAINGIKYWIPVRRAELLSYMWSWRAASTIKVPSRWCRKYGVFGCGEDFDVGRATLIEVGHGEHYHLLQK